jgi:hypothetical protein
MPKILSIDNVELFLNTLSHVHVRIFLGHLHVISNVGLIRLMVGFDIMLNYQLSQKFNI